MSLVYAMTGACSDRVTGGIATASRNNLLALQTLAAERQLPLRVLSLLEEPGDRPPFLADGVPFEAFDRSKGRFALRLLGLAPARPLFVFDHVSIALPLLPLAASGLARTVVFCHGPEVWRRVERSARWSLHAATLCLTNSEFTLRKMRETLGRFEGRACPLGLAPEFALAAEPPGRSGAAPRLRAADGQEREVGERALLLVGRMQPGARDKGHTQLIDALPLVRDAATEVQLVFAGPGDDAAALAARAREAGVGDRVLIPGRVSRETLQALYARAYAFAMPSRQEGFGLVYLEAMNAALPCIGCTDDGGEDVIVHGETGLLVDDPDDREALAATLRELLADPDRARRLGEAGFRRLHERFTTEQAQARVRESLAPLL